MVNHQTWDQANRCLLLDALLDRPAVVLLVGALDSRLLLDASVHLKHVSFWLRVLHHWRVALLASATSLSRNKNSACLLFKFGQCPGMARSA